MLRMAIFGLCTIGGHGVHVECTNTSYMESLLISTITNLGDSLLLGGLRRKFLQKGPIIVLSMPSLKNTNSLVSTTSARTSRHRREASSSSYISSSILRSRNCNKVLVYYSSSPISVRQPVSLRPLHRLMWTLIRSHYAISLYMMGKYTVIAEADCSVFRAIFPGHILSL